MSAAAGDLFPGSLPWSVLGALWAWLLALLLGASVLKLKDAPVSRLLSWAVVGIALQSYVWLLLGSLGALTSARVVVVASTLTLVSGALAFRRVAEAFRDLRVPGRSESPVWLGRVALGCLAVLLLVVVRLALLPSAHYDDLVYHLGLPRQALLTGSWPALPEFYSAFMPAAWEANYVLPLSLGGGSGPQLMNVVGLVLLAVAGYRLARLGGGPGVALAATALLLAAPLFVGTGSLASNDLFAGLALCVALDRLVTTSGREPFQVGLIAGAAWATKYTALPAVLALAVGAAMLQRSARAALVVVAALLVGMGWTARAVVLTGNPVYPAFYQALGGQQWSAQAASFLTRDSSLGAVPDRGLLAVVAAPVDVVRSGGNIGTPGGVSLVFLALALLGLFVVKRVRHAGVLLVFLGVTYAGWVGTSLMMRFAIALLVALLPFAAAALQRAWELVSTRFDLTEAAAVLVLLGVLVSPVYSGVQRELSRFGPDIPFWGGPARSELLSSRIRLAAAGRAMAETLPADARVLVIGDGRLALLPRPAVLSTAIDEPAIGRYLADATTPADLESRLSREFTHVVVNFRELKRWAGDYGFIDRLPPHGRELLAACFNPERPFVGRWGEVALYELKAPSLAALPR